MDDNFFGFDGWKDLLLELRATGKPFVFKQGLDVRLLDEKKAELLFTSRYDGDFWQRDLQSVLTRCDLLKRYGCLPYVMRHKDYSFAPPPISKIIYKLGALGQSAAFVLEENLRAIP